MKERAALREAIACEERGLPTPIHTHFREFPSCVSSQL